MAVRSEVTPVLGLSPRAKWIVRAVLIGLLIAAAVAFWRAAQPPTVEEHYRTLMGADELIGSWELTFERMSSPQTLAEAKEEGHAIIYGHFDGPSERDLVIYEVFEDVDAAKAAFAAHRESAATFPKFRDTPFYEDGDYQVVTAGYAQYATQLDNVVMIGEAWRAKPTAIDDTTFDRRAQSLLMIARKNYHRLIGR